MREFFSSKKFKILLAVLAVLIGFMVYTSVNVGMGNAVSGVVGVIVSPFQKLSAVISNSVTGFLKKLF